MRRTVAIYIYSDVVCKKDSMKEMDQAKLIKTLFFGNRGSDAISYIEVLFNEGGVLKFECREARMKINVSKKALSRKWGPKNKADEEAFGR